MTTTYDAWVVENAPIFSRLPQVYKDNPVTEYLTTFWDELLMSLKEKIDDLPRQLDPSTCDPNWLDFLAPFCGFTGIYWDKNWKDQYKRNLLAYSYTKIWVNKGSRDALSLVLACFEIPHAIANRGDFILGTSQVGVDRLGSAAWEYVIYLKTEAKDTPQVALVHRLVSLFGPCWCKYEIKFDSTVVQDYLVLNNEQAIVFALL